jgi:putative heme degradation protein
MAHGGREELASMDDLLPVMIFVTVRAAVPDFPGIVRIVDDYVKFKNVFELEERILTTLQVAIEDISQKWIKKERQSAILMEN